MTNLVQNSLSGTVEDDCISVLENTSPVIADLDCGEGEKPDLGTDICALTKKEDNGFGEDTEKPSSYTLTLGEELTSEIASSQGDKLEVGAVQTGDDGDGSYYVVVTRESDPSKTSNQFFAGTVAAGESFTASEAAFGTSFGSETYIHIFSSDGGTLLQTINFHTSCSAPLVIGDQYGSITLAGATLEGKDSGTFYEVGTTEADGDAGVVYEITGGADADDFTVDPATGVVTFISPPDYENPTDSDGDNTYNVEVTAFYVDGNGVKTGEICEVKPLEVCVEDDCISVLENTSPVIADLDCGEGEKPDLGTDICALTKKEDNGFGEDTEKPSSYTLTLGEELTSEIASSQGDKLEVGAVQTGDDGDGSYYVVVTRESDPSKTSNQFFAGTVAAGESFTASEAAFGTSFGSETYIHIFSSDGGTLLQTINFHTSCSAPLVIGDQYGSITLAGATLEGKDSGTFYEVGTTEADGDAGVVYEITGGADADDFTVDPATGVVTFISPPDYENPTDSDGDNTYNVEVTAFYVDGNGVKTGEICEVKPLEVCVEDDCISVLENTSPVIADLDCGEGEKPDLGTDICALTKKEDNGFGEDTEKPSSYTLTLGEELTSEIASSQGDKLEVGAVQTGDDGDGSYYVVVTRESDPSKTSNQFFAGTVAAGESFTASEAAFGTSFGSETYIHIFSSDGGTLLQTINFHTSCSAPLVIGDQYGSITLAGATLEGKDSGTFYEVGTTEADGDAGVVYEITGGADADDFTVDPATGVVTFISPPDYENPTDSDGDNTYNVEVTAFYVDGNGVKTGEICEVKPLEVCVDDELDGVCIDENTTFVVDVNLTVDCPKETPKDRGVDICAQTDKNVNGLGEDTDKPSTYILSLGALSDTLVTSDATGKVVDKVDVGALTGTDDGDGSYFVVVTRESDPSKTSNQFFAGTVATGESFTASEAAFGTSFGSETFVHIFSSDGGSLLQTINFHTSCSSPLIIGDQYGSITLEGATLEGKDSGTIYEVGGTEATTEILGEGDIVYSISGGADAALFSIDPDTGELSFMTAPDFENPRDEGVDNVYDVIVRATAKDDPTCFTNKSLEVCVQDLVEVGSLSGRYFCDTNDNDVDDGQAVDPGVAGVLVTLFDAAGNLVARTTTGAEGGYSFGNLAAGSYSVAFTDPDGVLAGKQLVMPNVGDDDTVDSDAEGDTTLSTIADIVVTPDRDTPDNDAGAEYTASLGDRVFLDDNRNGIQDAGEAGVADVTVTLTGGGADGVIGTADDTTAVTVTDADGLYLFEGLDPGTEYKVTFSDLPAGTEFTVPDNETGPDGDAGDSDADPANGMTQIVTLAPGEQNLTLDAGIVPLLGSISGRYFVDAGDPPDPARDCDGLDNDGDGTPESSAPVAGAMVELLDAAGNVVATTTTDATGAYSFTGLAADDYSVRFAPTAGAEFTAQDVSGDDAIDSDVDPATGETDTITLAPGEDVTDVDAGICPLGSLSGRYFCDTNDNDVDDGQAVDPGVAGVLVTLFDAAGNLVARTTTGAEGGYSFGNLAAGSYSVAFTDPDGVLAGKQLVMPNVGDDDTVDSDAEGDTTLSTIADIVVTPDRDTPDNDAGAEYTASLGDRVFLDDNRNGIQDAGEAGVADVTVTLTGGGADGVIGTADDTTAVTVTDADGLYLFEGLDPGTEYKVTFSDLPAGTEFTVTDNETGPDGDAGDSDADPANGMTQIVTLAPGEQNLSLDAGIKIINAPPDPHPDAGKGCADELIFVDVLGNDGDPDGDALLVNAIDGIAIVEGQTVDVNGVAVTLSGGMLSFDGEEAFASLDIGQEVTVGYTYTVGDGQTTATAAVEVTYCGDANSIQSFCDSLPDGIVEYQISTSSITAPVGDEGFDLKFSDTGDTRFDGVIFPKAYCLSLFDPTEASEDFATAPLLTGDMFCFEDAPADLFNPDQVSVANGLGAADNMDLVHWILNQDFENKGYSGWEVQRAIWELTDSVDTDYLDAIDPAFGDDDNVDFLVAEAISSGEGFQAGVGDVVGAIIDPNPETASNLQPFIVAMSFEDYDCLC